MKSTSHTYRPAAARMPLGIVACVVEDGTAAEDVSDPGP